MNNRGYIEIKGKYYLVRKKPLQELTFEDVKESDNDLAFLDSETNHIYTYNGVNRHPVKAGIYIHPEEEGFILIEYSKLEKAYTLDDVIITNDLDQNAILNLSENIEIPAEEKKIKATSVRTGGRKSSKSDEPLSYEIKAEDDEMVRVLKDTINDSKVSTQDVYDWHLAKGLGESTAYNLIYGLGIRSSISYAQFCKWADILKRDIELTLIKR